MTPEEAYGILAKYINQHELTDNEFAAFAMALAELAGQASCDEEAERLFEQGHYDKPCPGVEALLRRAGIVN